jgi:hypothetical protein
MTTLFPGPNYIGLVTATVGNTVGNATLNPSPNQIGSVTISHVVNSITTITPRTDYIGLVTATIVGTVNTGMLTIFPGPNQIGSVTVSNFTAPNVGNVTLNASSAQIGSVTVSNIPAVTQSGNWDIRSALSLASIYGKVDLVNGLPTSTNWIGLATVTQGNQPALVAGTAQIGSVTVSNWVSPNVGNVTLNASNAFIGIVTIANPASSSGMVTIFGGPNQIGSVTVSNFVAPNVGNITLNASNAFIGIATVVPIISSTVVNFLVSVASGAKTQFPTNTVRQGIIQAYSENVSNVFIGNSAVTSGISDTRGMELQAGQAAGIEIDQTSKLYVALATGASGALSFFGSS